MKLPDTMESGMPKRLKDIETDPTLWPPTYWKPPIPFGTPMGSSSKTMVPSSSHRTLSSGMPACAEGATPQVTAIEAMATKLRTWIGRTWLSLFLWARRVGPSLFRTDTTLPAIQTDSSPKPQSLPGAGSVFCTFTLEMWQNMAPVRPAPG